MEDNFTPQIQDALMEMFATEGWQYFIEDVTKNLSGVNTLDGITGEQQLGFMQGQVNTLRGVITYEDTIRKAIDSEAEEILEEDDGMTITLDG